MGDYNEFWFINTRVQTTNLKRWFLWGILLFAFVSVCTIVCVKSFYQPIKTYSIEKTENLKITVDEAKKTNANGYVKGTVTNTEEELKGKYIEFTFYTKHDVDIGKEYIEIGTLQSQESKTYEAKFKYPNVERFVATITDSKE